MFPSIPSGNFKKKIYDRSFSVCKEKILCDNAHCQILQILKRNYKNSLIVPNATHFEKAKYKVPYV